MPQARVQDIEQEKKLKEWKINLKNLVTEQRFPLEKMCSRFQDVKWLQSITTMPILVKGVVTAEDSELLDISVPFILWMNSTKLFFHVYM